MTDSTTPEEAVGRLSVEFAEAMLRCSETIARLTRERDAAFAMSRCECSPDECCANLVALKAAQPDPEKVMELADEYANEASWTGYYSDNGDAKNGAIQRRDAAREALRAYVARGTI